MTSVLKKIIIAAVLAGLLSALPAMAAPQTLRVVMDNNYPPYVFQDSDGKLQGILVDQWNLWEKQTGTHVEISAMDWGEALRRMEAGEFDVIDTIFQTEERQTWLDFTKAYAQIEVPIFFRKGISGLADAKSLKGFAVAAKRGDAAVELLTTNGVAPLLLFNNYEHIIQAAQEHKVNVFVVDAPPAYYFLNKSGIANDFRRSAPINVGEFHRAVRKGDVARLALVENGFASIAPAELAAIDKKWLGSGMNNSPVLKHLGYSALGAALLILLLAGWNWSLKRQVRRRTAALKQSEEALQASKAEIQYILDNTRDVIFQIDLKGNYIFANAAAERLTGHALSHLLQTSMWQLVPPEYHALLKDRLQRRIAGEKVENTFEFEIQHHDGHRVWVELTTSRVLNKEGNLAAIQGVARDISKRRKAEEELNLVNFAMNHVKEEVFLIDEQGRILYVNDEAVRLLGYSREELLKLGITDIDPDFPASRWPEHWQNLKAKGSLAFESRHRSKTGRVFPVAIIANFFSHGGREYNLGLARDMTEQRRAEAKAAVEQSRFKLIFDTIPIGIAFHTIHPDGSFTRIINDAHLRICGLTREQHDIPGIYGRITHPEDRPRQDRLKEQVNAGLTKQFSLEKRYVHADGKIVWVTFSYQREVYPDGTVEELTSVVDITERKQLEEQLRQAQKMEAIGQLSGGVAHDFNNILTVILGHASLLQNVNLAPAEIRECSSQIAHAAERAAGLTRQLLMFARKQKMQPVSLDLNDTVSHVTKMLQRILGEDVTLRTEFAPALPRIQADTGMIEQVILNLAVNARDAMGSGGKLTLRTDVRHDLETGKGERKDCVCLHVSDTGSGITPEILPRIFEPFFTTKEVGKGTGLGLATVYGIVQQHHGKIEVQSEPGRGTTFSVSFPISNDDPRRDDDDTQKLALPNGTETILLVEDESPLRGFVSNLLKRCGYRVLEAGSGPEALTLWEQHHDQIALLFTDVIMPENLNGLDLGRQLLADNPKLKVIYTSGYTGNLEGSRNLSLVEGVNFIRKPFKPEALAVFVRKLLDGKITAA